MMAQVVRVCVVVSTIGRTDRLPLLISSLEEQDCRDFVVGVCNQSGRDLAWIVNRLDAAGVSCYIVESERRGLSAGRNAVMDRAPEDVTHFFFPNDSSAFEAGLLDALRNACVENDVVAMTYMDGDAPRYSFNPDEGSLTRTNVWRIIEPAMAVSRRLIDLGSGFDERLGIGAESKFQSGEGTDLLLRSLAASPRVAWRPDLVVLGVAQSYGLSASARRKKLLQYGQGYSMVLRRHGYGRVRWLKAVLGPYGKRVAWTSWVGFADAASSSLGRFIGGFLHEE